MFVHAFLGLLLVWMCCIQVYIIQQYNYLARQWWIADFVRVEFSFAVRDTCQLSTRSNLLRSRSIKKVALVSQPVSYQDANRHVLKKKPKTNSKLKLTINCMFSLEHNKTIGGWENSLKGI